MERNGSANKYRLLILGGYLSFFIMGIANSIIGPTLKSMGLKYNMEIQWQGIIFTVYYIGWIVAVLAGGWITDRRGGRGVMMGGMLALALGGAGAALAPGWWVLLGSFFPIGIGCGIIDAINNLEIGRLSESNRSGALNLLHGFFGIGSLVGPIVAGIGLKSRMGYPFAYVVFGVLSILCFFIYIPAGFPGVVKPGSPNGPEPVSLKKNLKPFLYLSAIAFFYVGFETSVGGWTSTFLLERKGAGVGVASVALSVYWGGLMLGRYAHGVFFKGWSNRKRMFTSLVLTLAAYPLMIIVRSPVTALLLSGVVGMGIAPMFPTFVAELGDRTGGSTGRLTGGLIALAALGGLIIPPGLGVIGGRAGNITVGLWVGFALVPIMMAMVFGLGTPKFQMSNGAK